MRFFPILMRSGGDFFGVISGGFGLAFFMSIRLVGFMPTRWMVSAATRRGWISIPDPVPTLVVGLRKRFGLGRVLRLGSLGPGFIRLFRCCGTLSG